MRHALYLIFIVWLGCRPPEPPPPANGLVGVWRNQASEFAPEPCRQASIEFRNDSTVFLKTGKQTLTASYSVERGPSRLVVQQRDLRSNGEPNCQGISAEFVLEHYVNPLYVDVAGDTLRIYRAAQDHDPFMTALRVR
jgi:hypothetical protein